MKVVILAGGFGTRLGEETEIRPKPMVEIGGKPILWHIMKIYSHFGFNDFVILLGYKSYVIKEYFANYYLHQSDVTFDMRENRQTIHHTLSEPWTVTLVDTGLDTMTGGRIKRARKYIGDETFMLTYGDGVADVDIAGLLKFHRERGKAVTITTIQPEGRFGLLNIRPNGEVANFIEKPAGDGSWINGGFFVCEKEVFDYIGDDPSITFERAPLETLAGAGKLAAFKHTGFWQCMDTPRDRQKLETLWELGKAPWKFWN